MNRKNLTGCAALCALLLVQSIPVHADEGGPSLKPFGSYAELEKATEQGSLMTAAPASIQVTEALPIQFDLRDTGIVTPVRNQGSYGMCWSFSALASLESNLIGRVPDIDLSEWHLAYYTYSDVFGFPKADEDDELDAFREGGNYFMVTPMLTSWIGPVSESVFPFDDLSVLESAATADSIRPQAEWHVTESCLLTYEPDSEDIDQQIKNVQQAVYDGHVVSVSFYNKNSLYTSGNKSYYNSLPGSASTGGVYHAVGIVGWDDNYPASSFKNQPDRDGAWLCKNSWGTSWGDNGYFWLSYADQSIMEAYFLEAEDPHIHNDQFRHDDYGFWTSFSSATDGDLSDYMANIFTAEEDTLLTSVMFCSAEPDDDYQVTVYQSLRSSTNPTKGTAVSSASGTAHFAGYHTIDLDEPVYLQAGDTFSIVVKLGGSVGRHITCEAHCRYTTEHANGSVTIDGNLLTEEMILRTFQRGQSFYSTNGRSWTDLYSDSVVEGTYPITDTDGSTVYMESYSRLGNVCVRGLTQMMGDLDLNGTCNAVDAAELLIYAAAQGAGEVPEKPADWLARADINHDGAYNAADAAVILQIAAEQGAGS